MNTKEKVKNRIDEMNDQIRVWEAKIEHVKTGAKAEYEEKMAALKAKRNDIKAKYDKMVDSTEDKWEESKDVFSEASESFKEGFNKLKTLFS